MAATSRSRPCVEVDIHDDHSQSHAHLHSHNRSEIASTDAALGELSLNSIHNIKRKTSIESLARRLDNFHIHGGDKVKKAGKSLITSKDIVFGSGSGIEGKVWGGGKEGHECATGTHTIRRRREHQPSCRGQ
jgi:hypothetical protein